MNKNLYLICILSFLHLNLMKAQKAENYNTKRPLLLYENKGQVIDQNRNVRHDVRMIFSAPGFTLAIKNQGMSYELVSSKTYEKQVKDTMMDFGMKNPKTEHLNDSVVFESHRIDIDFVNANPNPIIIKEGQSTYYENYYTEYTGEEGVTNIYGYTKTILRDVWQHIDIEFITDGKTSNSFKYNFVIKPGGNINDIQLKYNGTTPKLLDNTIKITSSLGDVTESIPAVYYTNGVVEKPEVSYILKDNIISFAGKNINTDYNTLVIDPSIVWGTYYGGGDDHSYDIKKSDSGYFYITGFTAGSSGIATSGTHQNSYAGGYDVFLTKFSTDDSLIWGTYYGGSTYDYAYGIDISDSEYIYIVGLTASTSGIATNGVHQTSNAGGVDVLLAKFSFEGKRIWGSYYGGGDYDMGQGISIGDSDYIYITGWTRSDKGIASAGSYQANFNNNNNWNNRDAFISKFSSEGRRQWGTYYGGNDIDAGLAICLDSLDNIYITGLTYSLSHISSKGAYQQYINWGNGNASDAFIVKFSSTGTFQLGTYFGGIDGECAYSIVVDDSQYIYITGYTQSNTDLATAGAYKTTFTGSCDIFIAKFSDLGSIEWATYYGGDEFDMPQDICTDSSNNIYITGYTQSESDIATANAYQTSNKGGYYDAFILKFNGNGHRIWATYFGDSLEDESHAIIYDSGYVYITGSTSSKYGIATSGSHLTKNPGWAAFIAKFSTNVDLDIGLVSYNALTKNSCPDRQQIEVVLKNFAINTVKSAQIDWTVNDSIQKSITWSGTLLADSSVNVKLGYYNFAVNGTYIIKVWSSLPNHIGDQIPDNDTIVDTVIVFSPKADAGMDVNMCIGSFATFGSIANDSMRYSWSSSLGGFSDTSAHPKHNPQNTTSYYLVVTDTSTGCRGYDTVTLYVFKPNVITITDTICRGNYYPFASNNIAKSGTYYDTLKNIGGCDSVIVLNLFVNPVISATMNASICQGDNYLFRGHPLNAAGSYSQNLKNAAGCDSVINLNLTVNPLSYSTIKITICKENTYMFGGKKIGNAGTYYDTLRNIYGCDSVVTLKLYVTPPPPPIITGNPTTFCEGDSVILSAGKYKSYLWDKTETSPTIVVKSSGYYYVEVVDSNGCKNYSSPIQITVHANPTPYITKSNHSLQTGNFKTYQWYLNNNAISNANSQIYTPTVDGDYTVYVTDSNGCSGQSSLYTVGWTGIAAVENLEPLIAPNPTTGDVLIDFHTASNRILYIYDAWGKKVFECKSSEQIYKVSLNENYATGIYFFVLQQGGNYRVVKVVKN